MFTQGCPERSEPGYHGQQRPAGSDRHGFESAAGDWAVPQKAATALDRYGHVEEVAALVAFVAGRSLVHYRANLTVDGGMNA